MNSIDSIIFDLGGVIFNLCHANTIEAFSKLSELDSSQLIGKFFQSSLFDEYEMGRISSSEFRDGIRSLLNVNCSDQEIDDAWNAMLLGIPKERVELLKNLRTQKPIFLLSNTNEIHGIQIESIFAKSYGQEFENLSALFKQAYFSYLMSDRKPNPSIFQRIIDEHNLNPSRTLFIDDTADYIEGAKTTGLQTIHVSNGLTIHDLELV
ncbi:MAG: HAD family phosphatase [Cyanobacteriota bacterium]